MWMLAAPLVLALASGQAVAPQVEGPNLVRERALVPAVVSGVSLLGGVTFIIIGNVQLGEVLRLPTPEAIEAARSNARTNVVGGVALIGLGVVVAGATLLLSFWQPTSGTSVALVPLDGGGLFSVRVRLP